jgi:hypothetical protein
MENDNWQCKECDMRPIFCEVCEFPFLHVCTVCDVDQFGRRACYPKQCVFCRDEEGFEVNSERE